MALLLPLAALCILPFIISSTFMGLYWGLFSDAAKIEDEVALPAYYPEIDYPKFDVCFADVISTNAQGQPTAAELGNTKWTVIFTLNAVVYTLLTVSELCLLFSAFIWPLAFCGACGVCCTQMAHFAAVIVTGVFRYSSDGERCAEQTFEIPETGKSYEDYANAIQGLFISQCVLYCLFACCLGCLTQAAFVVAMHRKSGG